MARGVSTEENHVSNYNSGFEDHIRPFWITSKTGDGQRRPIHLIRVLEVHELEWDHTPNGCAGSSPDKWTGGKGSTVGKGDLE